MLIDADPQGHLSLELGFPKSIRITLKNMMENIIMGDEFDPREAVISHPEGVDIVASNKLLTGMDMSLITVEDREQILKKYLQMLYVIARNINKYHRFIHNQIQKFEGKQVQEAA